MGRWRILRGWTHSRGTRERVGSWWPNDSIIVRSSGITSITDIKSTTTKICAILLFQSIGLGLQIIDPNGFMPNFWYWQRSMKITYGGTWLTELIWSLSWIFYASCYGIWLRTQLIKRQKMGGADERWMRARIGTLGDHDLVTAPNIVENGFLMRINGRGSSSSNRRIYATTKAAINCFYKELLQMH